jgi:hypothetical protein
MAGRVDLKVNDEDKNSLSLAVLHPCMGYLQGHQAVIQA